MRGDYGQVYGENDANILLIAVVSLSGNKKKGSIENDADAYRIVFSFGERDADAVYTAYCIDFSFGENKRKLVYRNDTVTLGEKFGSSAF